jgi:hypothetical protein
MLDAGQVAIRYCSQFPALGANGGGPFRPKLGACRVENLPSHVGRHQVNLLLSAK